MLLPAGSPTFTTSQTQLHFLVFEVVFSTLYADVKELF